MTIQQLKQKAIREAQKRKTLMPRRHLSYDALTKTLRNVFAQVTCITINTVLYSINKFFFHLRSIKENAP